MKIIISLCLILLSSCLNAKDLTAQEITELHRDISAMFDAFNTGNPSLLIDKTHHSVINLVGGKESFTKIMLSAVEQFKSIGMVQLNAELKQPTTIYTLGNEEVCFVPRISVMEIQGKKLQSTGFLVAIRQIDSNQWSYLDGSGMRKNPALLWQLLPELPQDIQLPANAIIQL